MTNTSSGGRTFARASLGALANFADGSPLAATNFCEHSATRGGVRGTRCGWRGRACVARPGRYTRSLPVRACVCARQVHEEKEAASNSRFGPHGSSSLVSARGAHGTRVPLQTTATTDRQTNAPPTGALAGGRTSTRTRRQTHRRAPPPCSAARLAPHSSPLSIVASQSGGGGGGDDDCAHFVPLCPRPLEAGAVGS